MAEIFDVFLSYNHADKEAVRELVQALRDRGVRIWRDGDNLPLGQPWQKVVEEVIPAAPAAIAVIGPSGIGDWHRREIQACNTQNVQRGMPLIPILLPGAPDLSTLPPFLSELHGFDLREGFAKEMLDELARRIPKAPSEAAPPQVGAGPRLHNLPFLSIGDLLKGRNEDLQNLAASLQGPSQATVISQRQVIHGLGGIGKTRLAVEYAWRFGSRYEAVFFAGADTRETLRANLAALADTSLLNLTEGQAFFGKDHPHVAIDLSNLASLLQGHESFVGGRAVDTTCPRHRRGFLRQESSKRCHPPQQPGSVAPGHEPSSGGRAVEAAGGGNLREEPGVRSPQHAGCSE